METKWSAIRAIGIMLAIALGFTGLGHGLCLMNCTTVVEGAK